MAPIDRIAERIFARSPGIDVGLLDGDYVRGSDFPIRTAIVGSDRKDDKGRPFGNLVWPENRPVSYDAIILVDVIEDLIGSVAGWASRVQVERARTFRGLRKIDRRALRSMETLPDFVPHRLLSREPGGIDVYQEEHGIVGRVFRVKYPGLAQGDWFDGWANDHESGIYHLTAIAECAEGVIRDWARNAGYRQYPRVGGRLEPADVSGTDDSDGVSTPDIGG